MVKLKRLILSILIVIPIVGYSQYQIPNYRTKDDYDSSKMVFIDPDIGAGNGTGTLADPYGHWTDLIPNFQDSTCILIKAGTEMTQSIDGDETVFNYNYVGRYGDPSAEFPKITSALTVLNLRNQGSDVVFDSLWFWKPATGDYSQIIRFGDLGDREKIVLANCKVIGTASTDPLYLGNYPTYCIKGSFPNSILFHNEFAYSQNDGIYGGGYLNGYAVSNYWHHNNMGGVVSTTNTGDSWQLENAHSTGLYIANNWMDRSHTIWKFTLIMNSTLAYQSNVVAEWNTFVGPRDDNTGGATVRWLGGTDNTYTKNLTISGDPAIPCIDGYSQHINQDSPYGVRDNHFYGPGELWTGDEATMSPDNYMFGSLAEYNQFLVDSSVSRYGSDIDTSDFWGVYSGTNPCILSPISIIEDSIGNDTLGGTGNGYIAVTIDGGYENKVYSWTPSGQTTEDAINLESGSHTLTVTDDSSCYASRIFNVPLIDTTASDSTLIIDTIYSNLEDGLNVDDNMVDGNFDTRWSNNLSNATAIFVLNKSYTLESVSIAWYEGDIRKAHFSISVSTDSVNWTEVYNDSSSGDTTGYEWYDVNNTNGKYIKLEGYGNNDPISYAWTSITEFRAYGDTTFSCQEASISEVVTNEVDGDGAGAINITPSGGVLPYTYLWSPGNETTEDITSLSTGTYTVSITDDSSCVTEKSIKVYNNVSTGAGLVVDTMFLNLGNDVSIYPATGWISVPNEGTTDLSLDNADKRLTITSNPSGNASLGAYSSTLVNDSVVWMWHWRVNGTSASYQFEGFDPNENYDFYFLGVNADGRDSLVVEGQYALGQGLNTWSSILNISPGVDSIIDMTLYGNGATAIVPAIIIVDSAANGESFITYPIDYTYTTTPSLCNGDTNGSITLNTTFNGTSPYTYLWNIDSTTSSVSNLSAGSYNVTITDANDSTTIGNFTITDPDTIGYSLDITQPTIGQDNGQLRVENIVGGSGSYTIQWNDLSTALTLETIPAGDYWFIITDGNGCTTDTVNITLENQQTPPIDIPGNSTNYFYFENSTVIINITNVYID